MKQLGLNGFSLKNKGSAVRFCLWPRMNTVRTIKNSTKVKSIINLIVNSFLYMNDLLIISIIGVRYIFSNKNNYKPFTVLTAADSSHFISLQQLLRSAYKNLKNTDVIFYNLGLKNYQLDKLNIEFPNLKVKEFNYHEYPDYFDINLNAGEYAWKPVIIYKEVLQNEASILWMDAGNIITNNMNLFKIYIHHFGFYSPYSSDNIQKWTHQSTLKYYNFDKKMLHKRNLNGALIGINKNLPAVLNLSKSMNDNALKKDVIAPEGSSRKNHRQDQALLTLEFYQKLNFKFFLKTNKIFGVKIQQDID